MTCCNKGIKTIEEDGGLSLDYCTCPQGRTRRYSLPPQMLDWNAVSYPGPRNAIEVAWDWLQGDNKRWLILEGNYGAGKTGLAVLVYKAIVDRMIEKVGTYQFIRTSPRPAQFWFVPDLCQAQKDTYGKDVIRPVTLAERAIFLVLDDVGAERYTEDNVNIVAQLIQHRYTHNLRTVLTTNLKAAAMKDDFGPRVFDRLRDNATIISFEGGSMRPAPSVYKV